MDQPIDPERAGRLDRLAPSNAGDDRYRIDDRTWGDLEMDQVFAAIARTHSPPGAQLLYRTLREPRLDPEALEEREGLIDALVADPESLLEIRRALSDERQSWMLPDVLWRPLPRLPLGARFFWTIRAVAVIGAMVATAWWPPAALALIAALGANIVAGVALEQRILVYADALTGLAATLQVARRVAAALPAPRDERRAAIDGRLRRLAPLERKVSLVTLRDPTELLQLLQHMVGSKPLAYTAAVDFIEAEIDELRALYLEVAEIDVAIAVAWLREERSTCRPELGGDARALMIDGAIHPLLSSPVANDVELAVDRGLLITGSNMSGKTTYLKTIAVNAICAQSIDVAFARAYVYAGAGPLRVASSIDRLENLGEGQSYFMAEALSIKAVLEIAAAGPCLVVIDELFRGTNPADRIAAGLAVLDYLGPRALVALATHDGELGDRLAAGFAERHFRDTWDGAAMQFDYALRPGRSPRSNAIELLADVGYPAEIVEEAERHRQRPAV